MPDLPEPALIEIVEKLRPGDRAQPGLIAPNEIRINGVPILAPAGQAPIRVHDIDIDGGSVVMVTLTLYARRVTIGHEGQLDI